MSLLEQQDTGKPPTVRKVLHIPAGQGSAVWLNGDVYSVKVGHRESEGSLAVLEASVPPGGGPPLHDHRHEDEAFYLIEGELEIYAGDETYTVRAGDFVFVPRGTVHGFKNTGLHTAKQLLLFTPGGFERFFLEAGKEAVRGENIPPFNPADNPRAKQVAEKYGSYQA
ncbi:quercetin 2,3-dioxygenase [Streptomyces nitrosporeus]|uniref:quercetin 2,3-dioxygenase n=1 Tax=Streptomyces nitrosporeus TaxID=28894 RepID=UPI00198C3DA1|nr:quercetin 2,3-dioxygenase [Streptomyces nitrosporeus]GGZ18716.1 hypothetical protein GCM10010327_57390 [Streptomyces nitrosporeus]